MPRRARHPFRTLRPHAPDPSDLPVRPDRPVRPGHSARPAGHVGRATGLVLSLGALVAVGCGVADAESSVDAASADAVVVAEGMRFVDPPSTIGAGERVVVLHNRDHAPHDLTVDGPLGTFVEAAGEHQGVAEATFEPGTYTVYCAVGGHREAGMEFRLEVD